MLMSCLLDMQNDNIDTCSCISITICSVNTIEAISYLVPSIIIKLCFCFVFQIKGTCEALNNDLYAWSKEKKFLYV